MPSSRTALTTSRRIVVKVGTGVVTGVDGSLALGRLGHLVEQISTLRRRGLEVLLVSSGAIGLGAQQLGMGKRPEAALDRQACAAAGQGALIGLYDALFRRLGVSVAQVLLTEADFVDRRRYNILAATLERLLTLGAVPVINENDVVTGFGDDRVFSDNDRLAALVAGGLGGDALILLTDVEGVLTAPPGDPTAERISVWAEQEVVMGATSQGGTGGIDAKLEAARVASQMGVNAVIASGLDPTGLVRVLAGEDVGTLVSARPGMNRRRQWLAFATAPAGTLVVNDGARSAMVERQASLLAPGVLEVLGEFEPGAVVSVVCAGREFARGVCGRSAQQVRDSLGSSQRGKALVHRDHVAILGGPDVG
jgi:glutamate 5-kinase